MSAKRLFFVAGLLAVLSAEFFILPANAQEPKELLWTHAFDLKYRKFGEADFTEKKFGVEAFKDLNNDLGFYISQTGSLAAVNSPSFARLTKPIQPSKGPEWITGLDLGSRKAGEREFGKDTKKHSLEIFLDENTDTWFYITEQGYISATPAKGKVLAKNKGGRWSHSMDLSVRSGGVKELSNARKYGIEVYLDQNTDNLIYVCETGSIAVISDQTKFTGEGKDPEFLHGLDLKCRKPREKKFSKETRELGVEVFLDMNNGNLIFIAQTGNLAVCPGPKDIKAPTPTQNLKRPDWKHGLDVSCRKVGETDWSENTQCFGVEVFHDDMLGVTLYVGETGSIAAVKD